MRSMTLILIQMLMLVQMLILMPLCSMTLIGVLK